MPAELKIVSLVGVEAIETHRTIDAVWRMELARLIAGLARIVRDIGIAGLEVWKV